MRRFGVGITEEALRRLTAEVVRTRAPERLGLLDELGSRPLEEGTREVLRGLLADELVETGLDEDDEPNDRGRLIEAAIDWLGQL